MDEYEIRVDYADETYEVSIFANSVTEAMEIARRDPEVTAATLLCILDWAPQATLAWREPTGFGDPGDVVRADDVGCAVTGAVSGEMLREACDIAGIDPDALRLDYSGRGMFGAKCVGIVVDGSDDLLAFVEAVAEVADDTTHPFARGVREDSMGLSRIYYWPGVEVGA